MPGAQDSGSSEDGILPYPLPAYRSTTRKALMNIGIWPSAMFIILAWPASAQQELLKRSNPTLESITVSMKVTSEGLTLSRMAIAFPIPRNGIEQELTNLQLNGAQVRESTEGRCTYALLNLGPESCPKVGESRTYSITYDVKLWDLSVDFTRITEILPYDRESELYRTYTRNDPPILDLENKDLLAVSDDLWLRSRPSVLDYARAAYEHVARTFRYQNPGTGWHSTEAVLKQGGGDCGQFSSLFITLLRMKGIPARHNVGVIPSNSPHAWSEFYLEKWGWIPVDVTLKNSDPGGDYFGQLRRRTHGVITHKDLGLTLLLGDNTVQIPSIQSGGCWHWEETGKGTVQAKCKVTKRTWWRFW